MRLIMGMTAGLLTLSGLAACGQNEDAFRASYRTKAVESCSRGAGMAPNAAGIDTGRLCNCMVDAYMRATSTAQLKAEQNQTTAPPAAQAAMMQCAQEQARAMQGAAPGTPPASNEPAAASAPPEAPAPAADGEAAEGNETDGQ